MMVQMPEYYLFLIFIVDSVNSLCAHLVGLFLLFIKKNSVIQLYLNQCMVFLSDKIKMKI
jgi:hypothetical protein